MIYFTSLAAYLPEQTDVDVLSVSYSHLSKLSLAVFLIFLGSAVAKTRKKMSIWQDVLYEDSISTKIKSSGNLRSREDSKFEQTTKGFADELLDYHPLPQISHIKP